VLGSLKVLRFLEQENTEHTSILAEHETFVRMTSEKVNIL